MTKINMEKIRHLQEKGAWAVVDLSPSGSFPTRLY